MQRIIVTILLFGCVSYTAPGNYPQPEPMGLSAPTDSLWPAIIDVVNEHELSIKMIDRPSGFVQSERMWAGGGSAFWDCGTRTAGGTNNFVTTVIADENTVPVTVTVSAVPLGTRETRLRVTANVGQVLDAGGTIIKNVQCRSKGVFERELLDAISARWKELRR